MSRWYQASLVVVALGLGVLALWFLDGPTEVAYTIAIAPPALALPFAIAGRGRVPCLVFGALALLIELLLIAYSAVVFMPGTLVLIVAGIRPSPRAPD